MIQTPVFRNINIFFLIQTYGSYIYTVQKIILRPAGPRFITAMTGGGRWLQEGTQGEERGWIQRTIFSFFWGLDIHTSCGRSKVCTSFQIPSIPLRPQYTAPRSLILSHFHWIATTHTHTQSIIPFILSFIHTHSSFLLTFSFVYSALLFRYSFFLFFPLLIIYTRARSCLSFSYSATFKYRIFRNN